MSEIDKLARILRNRADTGCAVHGQQRAEGIRTAANIIEHESARAQPASAYCRACQAVGMRNCQHFDECSGATCATCHRPLNSPAQPASVAGWVMVPREASDHLAFAVSQCWKRQAVTWKDLYRHMISIIEREAPSQPETAQEGEG